MTRRLCNVLMLVLVTASAGAAEELKLPAKTAAFVETYCIDCHDAETEKGDRNFEPFLEAPNATEHLQTVEEILDQLNLGEMPPKKKSVTQPPIESTRAAIAALTEYLSSHDDVKTPSTTVLRRLNRQEYRNTMRDILGLPDTQFDPTMDFLKDQYAHDFDVIGSAQVLSDQQLIRYMEAAEAYLDRAFCFGHATQPQSQKIDFPLTDLSRRTEQTRGAIFWRVNHGKYIDIGHGSALGRQPEFSGRFARHGVPHDGYYRIKVRAGAIDRVSHPYDPKMIPLNRDEPMKMGIWNAPTSDFFGKSAVAGRQLLDVVELPDNGAKDFEIKVWLTEGSIPAINWINGYASKGVIRRISERYHERLLRPGEADRDLAAQGDKAAQALVNRPVTEEVLSDVYRGPRMRIHSFSIDGPHYADWPPSSHQRLFGNATNARKVDVSKAMLSLANHAFRRPATADEVAHYVAFAAERRKLGDNAETALKLAMAALLSSPNVLYLNEGDPSTSAGLSQYELATRLSYFLWSSTPDDALLAAAAKGELADSADLAKQVDRMLSDRRSDSFVERFLDNWLGLHRLGSMPPDERAFKQYYDGRLEQGMRTETRLFFRHMLSNNRPITDFLNSDYTFVNQPLAGLYGIPNVNGEQFRRVNLAPDSRRGGLLGHGSVLTVTANGIDTSPVVRGVWVLEKILGTPPPQPPPDVEPIEPDTRGTTSIREQLKKHREEPACADCHAKIDPLGFALEFYDPIGGFREYYGRVRGRHANHVDGSGALPSGETFTDERQLKSLLLDRKDLFARNLTSKLLTYGTGREMTFRDQPEIRQIAADNASADHGMRTLVHQVVASDIFKRR